MSREPRTGRMTELLDTRAALADLRDAVEIMDQKITPFSERGDGTVSAYIVGDSTWHRVLAIARGSTSEAARAAIDNHRAEAATPAPLDADLGWLNLHRPQIDGDVDDSTWLTCSCGWDSTVKPFVDWVTHMEAAALAASAETRTVTE